MKGVRIFYNDNGWIVETPIPLSEIQLEGAIKWHKNIILDRMKSYSKEKQEFHGKLLNLLTAKTITHHLIPAYPWEQDRILV